MKGLACVRSHKWVLILTIMLSISSPLYFLSFEVHAAPVIGSTTATLYPIADAYVNSSSPDINFGNEDYLYVSSESDYTYIMFDLSSIPSGANVISAEVEVYVSDIGGYTGSIGVHYCSDDSWTEIGITWNNKPDFAETATSTVYYGMFVYLGYDSWDVTIDVRSALSKGKFTEVLVDHRSSSHAYFNSREGSNSPRLKVEYATLPVFVVHLESTQDTGATNNLGLTTFVDYTSSLPTDIDVVAGSYQVRYSGGYMFMRWATSGGVAVSDVKTATTTVTVSGEGTLWAVGNAKRLEYAYDHEDPEWASEPAGCIDAVRVTPLFSGQLLMARFYIYETSSYQSNTFYVHVMNENRDDIITPFERTPTSKGWFDVDLSSYGISVDEATDFYIGMEWIADYNPDLGEDRTSPSGRSWHWNGTDWQGETYSDFMIRAVVGTLIDHVIVADGTVFDILTESNSAVSNFQFIKDDKRLLFDITGPTGTDVFCNITIPRTLMWVDALDEWNITINGTSLSVQERTITHNETHYTIYFTCSTSTVTIQVISKYVIPEFPSLIILPLFMITTLLAIIAYRRKLQR